MWRSLSREEKHMRPPKCFSRYLTLSANFGPDRLTSKPSFCEILKGSTKKLPPPTSVPRSNPLLKNRIPGPKYLEVHTWSKDVHRIIERLRFCLLQIADAVHFHAIWPKRMRKKIRQQVAMVTPAKFSSLVLLRNFLFQPDSLFQWTRDGSSMI